MIFNTGSALLDAVVLAVVSRDADGTYGYKITQMYGVPSIYPNPPYIRCFGGFRRKTALRYMTWPLTAETADIIKLRKKAGCS